MVYTNYFWVAAHFGAEARLKTRLWLGVLVQDLSTPDSSAQH